MDCAFVFDGAFAERTPSGSKIFELEPIEAKRQQLHACVEKAVGEAQTPPQRESPREGSTVASSHRRTSSTPSDRFDDGIDFERIFQGTDSKPALSRTASEASVRPLPDPNNPFHRLPDELLSRILGKLEEADLGRVSAVSRKWRQLACDPVLWRQMSRRWFLLSPEALTAPTRAHATRSFYVERFKRFKVLRAEAHARQEAEAERQRQLQRQRRHIARVRRAEDVLRVSLFNRVADYFSYFGLLLGTIFIVLKLDKRVDWPWSLALIPFAFPLFHALFALVSYDCVRCIFGAEVQPNLNGTLGAHTGQGHAVGHVFTLMRAFHIETYVCIFAIVSSAIMIWYKLATRSLSLPWWAVLMPLIIASFCLFLATILGNTLFRTAGQLRYPPIWRALYVSDRSCMSYYTVLGMLTLIFVTLMLARRVTWTWWAALAPVWAVGVGCVLTPLFYFCLTCFGCRTSTIVLGDRGTACICWLSTWLFFLGPLMAFLILLASNLTKWHWRSWAAVFAPLFVLEVILFCVCIAYDVVILSDD